jgi:MFS family permease
MVRAGHPRAGQPLPRAARVVLAGDALSSLGSGLTMSFLVF